jgi:hypothetical protein
MQQICDAIRELLGEVFYMRSVPRCYKHDKSRVSCETVVGQYGVGSHCQATTGEDTTDWEDLVRAVVNCRLCELKIALQLLVVTFCNCIIQPIIDPNPVYNYSNSLYYIQYISVYFYELICVCTYMELNFSMRTVGSWTQCEKGLCSSASMFYYDALFLREIVVIWIWHRTNW